MAVVYVLMYFKCKICFTVYTGETKIILQFTLVNVNALVVATTSWWLHFSAPVVASKVKKSIPVDFIIYL